MKKTIFYLFAAIISLTFAACSSSTASKAADVAQKIESNDELSQEDYTVMLQYSIEAFDDAIKAISEMKDNPTDTEKSDLEDQLNEKYPYMETFAKVLAKLDESDLDDTNKALYDTRLERMRKMLGLMMSK